MSEFLKNNAVENPLRQAGFQRPRGFHRILARLHDPSAVGAPKALFAKCSALVENFPISIEFIDFLKSREEKKELKEFTAFSLEGAMDGMEGEEDLYGPDDIIEKAG